MTPKKNASKTSDTGLEYVGQYEGTLNHKGEGLGFYRPGQVVRPASKEHREKLLATGFFRDPNAKAGTPDPEPTAELATPADAPDAGGKEE